VKLAYIDHSFHRQTLSTKFFSDLLLTAGEIDFFWDESWSGGPAAPFDRIRGGGYDAVIVFQSEVAAAEMARRKPSCPLVFIPMWDSSGSFGADFWRRDLAGTRIVCFSSTQASQLARWGIDVMSVRYWLEPPAAAADLRTRDIRGLFWWRREEWPLRRILQFCDPGRMQSLHVHLGPDPGNTLDESQLSDAPIPLTVTRWGENAEAYRQAMLEADLIFAPRLQEGFGTTVLEAMAAGKAVAAPDAPAMNEYLTDDVTGYLLPPGYSSPLNLDRIREIGRRAREQAVRGRQQWVEGQQLLLDWMLHPAGAMKTFSASSKGSTAPSQGVREKMASGAELLVGHYAETVGDFLAERRTVLPVSWPKWSGHLAALLPRVPPPEAVTGSGAPGKDIEASAYAELLRVRDIRHLDEISAILPPTDLMERRRRLRFQADVLRAWGFPAAGVESALQENLRAAGLEDYEAVVSRGQLRARPRHWPEWWRRTWHVWRRQGLRGGLKLLIARLKKKGPPTQLRSVL
jgi:hypothetical protein